MPTLRELKAEFLRYDPDGKIIDIVPALADAHGLWFKCPLCFVANSGIVGTHHVICWSRSRGVPDDAEPGPGRWTLDGTDIDDLTLNGDSPEGPGTGARSVQLNGGCNWHGFVTNGVAE